MFGQLRVSSKSLSPQPRESYRADFCSLCHTLRSQDGYLATVLTNYDSTFWLSVAAGLEPAPLKVSPKRCTAMPFRTVAVREHSQAVAKANTAILWMLVRAKAQDDSDDEGGWKARAALRLSASKALWAERYLVEHGFDTATIAELPHKQRAAESDSAVTFAKACAPTQQMMAEVFGHLAVACARPEKREGLRRFGSALGACLYLHDALCDHLDDVKGGRFNPLFFCADSLTRPAIANLVIALTDRLLAERLELELCEPSRTVVETTLHTLTAKLGSHPLLGDSKLKMSCCATRPRKQAAFCTPGLVNDPAKDRHPCKNCCDCDVGECCCELPDCCGCDCCSCDGCSGCDCGGCACSAWLPKWPWKLKRSTPSV